MDSSGMDHSTVGMAALVPNMQPPNYGKAKAPIDMTAGYQQHHLAWSLQQYAREQLRQSGVGSQILPQEAMWRMNFQPPPVPTPAMGGNGAGSASKSF